MLVPAILYKDQLTKAFSEIMYTDNYFYYNGCGYCHSLPEIKPQDNVFQFACITGEANTVVGYFAYTISPETDTVWQFGAYSFYGKNPVFGKDVLAEMKRLIKEHRRIEWRMIGDNPVQPVYDRLCKHYGGNKVVLHDVCKDNHSKFHDEHIYEILRETTKGDIK